MGRSIKVLTIGLCGLLWQSADAQGLPKYSDITKDTTQLKDELHEAKSKAFDAIIKNDMSKFTDYCDTMKKQDSNFIQSFYANTSYLYFAVNDPKNYKEQYLKSTLLTLLNAMSTRMQAIYIGCSNKDIDKSTMASVLALLSNAYNSTQTVELWTEVSSSLR